MDKTKSSKQTLVTSGQTVSSRTYSESATYKSSATERSDITTVELRTKYLTQPERVESSTSSSRLQASLTRINKQLRKLSR